MTDASLALADVDQKAPYTTQGYQLIYTCVSSIFMIYEIIEHWESEKIETSQQQELNIKLEHPF